MERSRFFLFSLRGKKRKKMERSRFFLFFPKIGMGFLWITPPIYVFAKAKTGKKPKKMEREKELREAELLAARQKELEEENAEAN